jgi:Cytochrome c biogenesis factor
MYLFGTMLIVSGVVTAILATIGYLLVTLGKTQALPYARTGVYLALAATVAVSASLIVLFVSGRYDIKYVNDYTDNAASIFFKVASIWAGQPGSFVIWTLWGMISAALMVKRTRQFEPYVLSIFMFIQAALLVFMLVRNPFVPNLDPITNEVLNPADGKGLNPLLHNFWMIIHPPVLFWGFALAAVPFAFALAGLWRRDYDMWVVRALPWTIAAWAFLGLALVLGGYWAYETLGWGGYWGWDPVENSSLVPWLMLTALLHTMLLQKTHGGLRRSNFVLAVFTYILVFYSTFLTRSGVLSNFSVHSFVEEGLKTFLFVFLALLIVGGVAMIAWRWRDIPTLPLSDKLLSRDSFFVLGALTLVLLAVIICLGTSMPLISSIPGVGHSLQRIFDAAFETTTVDMSDPNMGELTDGRFNMATSFYQETTPPLGLVVVLLLILGPLLGWRDTNIRNLFKALTWPAVAGVVVVCFSLVIGVRDLISLGYLGLGTFAAGTNLVMIIRTLKGGWMRIGGYLSHVGLMIMFAGVVGSSAYASPDERLVIAEGDTIKMHGFGFTFKGYEETEDKKGYLHLVVEHNGKEFKADPHLYVNERMGATMQTPSIHSFLWRDLYITPVEFLPRSDPNAPIMAANDTVEIGPYKVTFVNFDIDRQAMMSGQLNGAEIGAKLLIEYEGQTSEYIPRVRLVMPEDNPDSLYYEELPVTIQGGHKLALVNFDPNQRLIALKVLGLNLPAEPAKAIILVSTKPAVVLVWLGVFIGILGGFIALVRRYLEGETRLKKAKASVRRPENVPSGAGALANLLRTK